MGCQMTHFTIVLILYHQFINPFLDIKYLLLRNMENLIIQIQQRKVKNIFFDKITKNHFNIETA